jgi:hypothetical protein
MKKDLSQKQYVALNGDVCPVCGSDDVEFDRDGTVSTDGDKRGFYLIPITCTDCQSYWSDKAKLVGYSDLEHGDNVPVEVKIDGKTFRINEEAYNDLMAVAEEV